MESENLFVGINDNIKAELSTISYSFNIPYLEIDIELKGLENIYEFFNAQKNGWKNLNEIPKGFQSSRDYFENSTSALEAIVNSLKHNPNYSPNLDNQLQFHSQNNNKLFTYDSIYTVLLLDLYNNKKEYYDGAFAYITKSMHWQNLQTREYFSGCNIAYELMHGKANNEFSRSQYEIEELKKIKDNFSDLLSQVKSQINDYSSKSQQTIREFKTAKNEIITSQNNIFDDLLSKIKGDNEKLTSDLNKKIESLELTYREKLKLEAPADQWEKRSIELNKKARRFLWILIGLSIVSASSVYALLWLSPDGMLLNFIKDDLKALRWSVIFITFLSFIAFAIRAFYKLTMSNYHLAKDAEERKQLTYLYLALVKDSKIDSEERRLILQSLFSRADTGLLKEDSSPTMPNIINKNIGTN